MKYCFWLKLSSCDVNCFLGPMKWSNPLSFLPYFLVELFSHLLLYAKNMFNMLWVIFIS